MSELPTEPVQRLIGKYEQRISKLEDVNGKLCAEINRQERVIEVLTAKQGGECEIDYERHCSNCGVYVHENAVLVRKSLGNGTWTVVNKPVSYCPNCGKAVKR